ncbi:MAG: sulfur carrier protein ThiS, partial [Chloroflexi bacterium]|nr:sulfur carrier protein ThiS [Chloroflexota bacterium]
MRILVNGKPAEIPEGITVQALLESKNLPPGSVAIALNGSIAPADQWGTIR